MTELGGDNGLYYDDLRIGQRFTSKTHVVDEEQIKAFAASSILSLFTLIARLPRTLCFRLGGSGWHTAAITMRLLVEGGLPVAGGIVGAAVN